MACLRSLRSTMTTPFLLDGIPATAELQPTSPISYYNDDSVLGRSRRRYSALINGPGIYGLPFCTRLTLFPKPSSVPGSSRLVLGQDWLQAILQHSISLGKPMLDELASRHSGTSPLSFFASWLIDVCSGCPARHRPTAKCHCRAASRCSCRTPRNPDRGTIVLAITIAIAFGQW
ncbi:hypothetical protein C8J56DRAFT_921091 [Mycena floridula]|nr:hypothetical protein C8J56DRAFT_921091 [Mycena floridula]